MEQSEACNPDYDDVVSTSLRLKAVSDHVRMKMLHYLHAAGTASNTELGDALGLAPALVSHHLAILAESGIVTVGKNGRTNVIEFNPERYLAPEQAYDVYGIDLGRWRLFFRSPPADYDKAKRKDKRWKKHNNRKDK